MFHAFLTLGLAALALGSFAPGRQAPASRPASEARTQTVYVTVLGPKNAPVTGLSAADFSVREDNAPREVLKAEIATDPMQVVLLVDDSQASTDALQPLREGLTAFVDKLNGHGEIGIVTSGDRATSLVGDDHQCGRPQSRHQPNLRAARRGRLPARRASWTSARDSSSAKPSGRSSSP